MAYALYMSVVTYVADFSHISMVLKCNVYILVL